METVPHAWVTLAPHKRTQRKDSSQIDAVLTIEGSPSEFTGECEIQRTPNGYFCRKHRRPVERDATRCDSFVRRRSFENYEDIAQRFVEEYVRNVLGIEKGKNYRRLVGWIADAPSPDLEDSTQQE
ncbi:MAG TPA: hypothetical protein VEC02_02450 [Nitrososphaerales archaeon]|nr:hypothetical protein [Nitrososphaerales archaeon]